MPPAEMMAAGMGYGSGREVQGGGVKGADPRITMLEPAEPGSVESRRQVMQPFHPFASAPQRSNALPDYPRRREITPSPPSEGERVGVRGCDHYGACRATPSPAAAPRPL